MIEITSIEVDSVTSSGSLRGSLPLDSGLNVLSAENAYGKSLAMTAIPWCLGLETMFGLRDNDPSRFPLAVLDVVELDGGSVANVVSSVARVTLRRTDGATLTISRSIKGGDSEIVDVVETASARTTRLLARRKTLKDETGGLQHFLFEWIGLPRAPLMNLKGDRVELYLENLAPLFFIDQNEGWTDLQALQVYRYGIQEVCEAAVEYMLGATSALDTRLHRQQSTSLEARLKAEAEKISEQVEEFFARSRGTSMTLSTHGSVADIAKRWAQRDLGTVAREDFQVDLDTEVSLLDSKIVSLRDALSSAPIAAHESAPSTQASQSVVELKTKRHELRKLLRESRMQLDDQRSLLQTTEHRLQSSRDVSRLKTQGVGRFDVVECPTCHRDLDPSTFDLSVQSVESVDAHIASLEKQRTALTRSISALEAEVKRIVFELGKADEMLVVADRALESVNRAVGSVRERLTKVAVDLAAVERERDAADRYKTDLASLEEKMRRWLAEVSTATAFSPNESDLDARIKAFESALRGELVALGFSAVNSSNASMVSLGERYVPYLASRRLRSLGSASDHARLVAAYVLALAEASRSKEGPHPGFVVLDEPLQQNPDPAHRELVLKFFETASSKTTTQVIVMTSLRQDEIARLKLAKVNVTALEGRHFLQARPADVPKDASPQAVE